MLTEIQEEIKSDFPNLPFEFNIRMIGTALVKSGITQNQRPGTLEFKDKKVAEILTDIMVRAKPNKDITGSNDPNCKLIWVVADDPKQPGQKAILVTTRANAADENYSLPDSFKEK